jgi:hypothetical protein
VEEDLGAQEALIANINVERRLGNGIEALLLHQVRGGRDYNNRMGSQFNTSNTIRAKRKRDSDLLDPLLRLSVILLELLIHVSAHVAELLLYAHQCRPEQRGTARP